MDLGEEYHVIGKWFRLHYLLNPGMAFGIEFKATYGKFILTGFRILASAAISYAIYRFIVSKKHPLFIACLCLILGGAVGNVIDSVFYGVFLEQNVIPGSITPWFHGQVIDMLYFPIFRGFFPDWLPFWGGQYFVFFSPVFNIADSAIFVGVVLILIFQGRFSRYNQKSSTDTPLLESSANDIVREEISHEESLSLNDDEEIDDSDASKNNR